MKNILKILIVFMFLGFLVVKPTPSYAWHHRDYIGVNFGVWPGYYYGNPYYYDYPYYPAAYYPTPAYVVAASSTYQPVVVNGVTYYLNNGVYYIYTQYGYQAVATPAGVQGSVAQPTMVTAASASVDTEDTFTINIPNDKGGYNAVVLKRSGKGYIGPQGEFYADFPKVAQLQAMYGK
jgi:hypothetical protein